MSPVAVGNSNVNTTSPTREQGNVPQDRFPSQSYDRVTQDLDPADHSNEPESKVAVISSNY